MDMRYVKFYICLFIMGTLKATNGDYIDGQPLIQIKDNHIPHYQFQYSVHDVHTGDVKDQFEHRHGDYVTGRYSFIEPNGNRRIVDYTSDPMRGFLAQVRHELPTFLTHQQHQQHQQLQPITQAVLQHI